MFFVILILLVKDQKMIGFELLFATICLVNLAYWCQSISKTTEGALLANNFSCMDATFLTFFLMLCMLQISKVKIGKWVIIIGMLLNIVSLTCVFSSSFSPLYCESANLVVLNGYSRLDKVYGPLRYLFLAILVLYLLITLLIVIYAVHHRKKVSYIYTIALAAIEIVTIGSFVYESIANLYFEILPFVYAFMEIILLFVAVRTRMYETSRNAQITSSCLNEYGYVTFDMKKRYVGSDDVAVFYFPEIADLEIDKEVKDGYMKDEFISWIDSEDRDSKIIVRGEKSLWCSIKPLYIDRSKKQIGYLLEIRDDTERQNYIRELNIVNKKLELLAKEADAANNAKSAFLSSMSHEIRTPINTIMGMNEMIVRETDNPIILEYTNDAKNASDMLLALVNDILDFSKIESGKMELVLNDYEPADLIRNMQIMVQTRAELKNLKFHVKQIGELPAVVHGDEMKLRQIVLNLLTNAIKYTDEGAVTFEYGFQLLEGDQAEFCVRVIDTGRGIEEENIDKLFNAFSRVDEVKNRSIEGTGLGLSITKKFIEMMDGTITVTSEYGKGSCFEFRVLQSVVRLDFTEEELKQRELEQLDLKEAQKRTEEILPPAEVLVVDDVSINLKVFKGLLKKTDLKIDTAENGKSAFEKCCSKKYDIIFLDHMMPEMDGVECFHYIKESEDSQNRKTPVIMLTANAISGVKEEYLQEGFSGYLAKPFEAQELNEILVKFLC